MIKKITFFLLLAGLLVPVLSSAAETKDSALAVIGAVENLTLVKEKLQFPARIDTGATTSSLSAVGIQPFERDGRRWVRFQVKDAATGQLVKLSRPLERMVQIKRHGAPSAERPVVKLQVSIGKVRADCEFSLVDRSDYTFPALIGRNFLNGKAMVDVSREYIVHPINQEKENAN
jgi:hypothetical protein